MAEVAEVAPEVGADVVAEVAPEVDAGGAPDAGEVMAEPVAEDNIFAFSDADADEGDAGAESLGSAAVFELPSGSPVPVEYAEGFGKLASELGVDGGQAGRLIDGAWRQVAAQEQEALKVAAERLRAEWGPDFEANMVATKKFAVQLARRAGMTVEEMGPMKSPNGFRLMNAMRAMLQEGGGYAGGSKEQKPLTKEQEIDRIYETPELFRALVNASDPKHEEVNRRLNKLMGII